MPLPAEEHRIDREPHEPGMDRPAPEDQEAVPDGQRRASQQSNEPLPERRGELHVGGEHSTRSLDRHAQHRPPRSDPSEFVKRCERLCAVAAVGGMSRAHGVAEGDAVSGARAGSLVG